MKVSQYSDTMDGGPGGGSERTSWISYSIEESDEEYFSLSPFPGVMATASEIDEFDASTLYDLSKGLQPDSSNLSSIAEERNNEDHRQEDPQTLKQMRMYRARHYSIGNALAERTGLRKSTSPYTSFDETSDVYGIIQLNVLKVNTVGIDINDPSKREWKEIARWIKYEQDLEEGADRLGRPHIAPLAFHFIMRLNYILEKNAIALLDLEEKDMAGIASRVTEVLIATGLLQPDEVSNLMDDLLLKQRLAPDREKGGFVSKLATTVTDGFFDEPRSVEPSPPTSTERRMSSKPRNIILRKMAFANRSMSFQFQQRRGSESDIGADTESVTGKSPKETFFSSDSISRKRRSSIQLVLQASAESSIIMVRGDCKRRKGAFVFVRLAEAVQLIDVSMIPTPTRILTIILAPTGSEDEFVEMGRSFGTLMSNRRFYDTTLNATTTKDILSGINEFLHECIVLPPGEWYTHENLYDLLPQHELERKNKIIQRQKYKATQKVGLQHYGDSGDGVVTEQFVVEMKDTQRDEIPGPFSRTGKPFGGLVNDIRRRFPRYKADFLDGISLQCLAATIFLYFASIAHNVTFGGLLAQKTKKHIGVPETLVAATGAGIIFALFSGQPLLPIAPTAPLLLFDEILYRFLEDAKIEFLPARTWIGFWVLIISIIYVGFEGSVITKNFTRFTQETFAALISVVFVYESFTSLFTVYKEHPLNPNYNETHNPWVDRKLREEEAMSRNINSVDSLPLSSTLEPPKEIRRTNEPNTALLSTFLMFGTFFIGFTLKKMRTSQLFGEKIRNTLSDFSVPIAIFVMVTADICAGDVYTTKIEVPTGIQTTMPHKRGWVIPIWGMEKPFDPWVPLITLLPGTLVFILMSMTLEICELILSDKDKLDKGNGFHLDVLILGIINFGSGIFGFPWLSCATLKALAHCAALTVYSRNNPPGSPPVVIEIIQERLTALVMSLMIGLSILAAPLLKNVSMSVLFGVFLYMGITSLINTQFYQRILLFVTPTHQHPPVVYVRRVPTWKIHLFTLIQIGCIILLWVVKSIKAIALTFPFIIMLLVPIRINLKYIFTENELEAIPPPCFQLRKGEKKERREKLDGKAKPPAPVSEKALDNKTA